MPHLGALGDDGIYTVTAQSLARGQGYRIASLPGEPLQKKYPILYPLVLSAIWRMAPDFPANAKWIMLASWVFLPVFLVLCRLIAREFGLAGWRA